MIYESMERTGQGELKADGMVIPGDRKKQTKL